VVAPKPTSKTSKVQRSFGESLRQALADRGMSQQELAERLGLNSQSVISQWISSTHEPSPTRVFAVERHLDLRPGQLSRLLGYLPVDAVPALDVPSAVSADPGLSDQQKEAVLAVYRVLIRPASRRRR
jgi:transcriptional regulator with XRE-family HTH domain